MDITVRPSHLSGTVRVPASKSYAHRQLIAAALSESPTEIILHDVSADIDATVQCLTALGAKIKKHAAGYSVTPICSVPSNALLPCNESGSTLRFLLPVSAALDAKATFTGNGRLPLRPNTPLLQAMERKGVSFDSETLPLQLTGKLQGGLFEMPGNISSQYITGLLLALPLCVENSEIRFTTPLESAGYVDITCSVLSGFGIRYEKTSSGYLIPGNQKYCSPKNIIVEGDWSSAVFWHCANSMGHEICVQGVLADSLQGDRVISHQIKQFGDTIDVSQTPDSLPALAVAACMYNGTTRFVGAGRLRLKESDRLFAIEKMLKNLGQSVIMEQNGLTISGGYGFEGGTVDGCNDHRIVMAAALAGSCAKAPVTIIGAEAVQKSYPCFFDDFVHLGGIANG